MKQDLSRSKEFQSPRSCKTKSYEQNILMKLNQPSFILNPRMALIPLGGLNKIKITTRTFKIITLIEIKTKECKKKQ